MKDDHTLRMNIIGDGNIGIFCVATDNFCLVPNGTTESQCTAINKVLKVDVYRTSVGYTNFLGIFMVASSNGIVASDVMEEDEKIKLENETGMKVCILDSLYNAPGNLITANDNGAMVSPLYSKKQRDVIENCLSVPIKTIRVAGAAVPGSGCLTSNKGTLLHRDIKDKEKETIESILKTKSMPGTLGMGSPWVGAAGICNSNGMFTGKKTTIHEIVRADEALGFV